MSVESAKKFLEKLTTDAAFKKSIEDAEDDATRQQVVKGAGYEFTKDDLKAAAKEQGKQELSDDDLESVAGGSSAAWVAVAAGGGGAAAAAL